MKKCMTEQMTDHFPGKDIHSLATDRPVMSGKPQSWSIMLERFTAAYNRPEQRHIDMQGLGAGCFQQCLSRTQDPATVPSMSDGCYLWEDSFWVGFRLETTSRTGSCHPHTLLGTRHIPFNQGSGEAEGSEGVGRNGVVSVLLSRRQRAIHDLIKMPINGLRR